MNAIDAAKRLSEAEGHVVNLGATNSYGLTAEERVASSARYRLALEALELARRDYREAISSMTQDELMELTREPPKPKKAKR